MRSTSVFHAKTSIALRPGPWQGSSRCSSPGATNFRHHEDMVGRRDQPICRGGRTLQALMFHRPGVLDVPTDGALAHAMAAQGFVPKPQEE